MTKTPHLLVLGPGYSARAILQHAVQAGWQISATWRTADTAETLTRTGINPVPTASAAAFGDALVGLPPVSHILCSVAPGEKGDPLLPLLKSWLAQQTGIRWIGYLSSTNVYGDQGGDWVDENSALNPGLDRGKRRVAAEAAWTQAAARIGARLHIFRLAGIYGPGRNAVRTLLEGRARRIVKPGQIFSRIHVADIGGAVWAAMQSDAPTQAFNLADDAPCPPEQVIEKAAQTCGLPVPPAEDWDTAAMTAMARSFYSESKRVRNDRVKQILAYSFRYPSFEAALQDLIDIERTGK